MSQSLVRAIKLLDCFAEKPELSLLELVEVSDMPKTTVFRLVNSLVEAGLLVKVKYSSHEVKYKLGFKLLELGMRVNDQLQYREIALPYMRELNEKLNELVHLAVIEEEEAVFVEKLQSTKPIRLVIKVGDRAPLYASCAAKVLLANLEEKDQKKYLGKLKLKKVAKNTIIDMEQLTQELQEIREKGYAFSNEEMYEDTIGYSAPLFNSSGEVIAALGVSIPLIEYSKEDESNILIEVIATAKKISSELGYQS